MCMVAGHEWVGRGAAKRGEQQQQPTFENDPARSGVCNPPVFDVDAAEGCEPRRWSTRSLTVVPKRVVVTSCGSRVCIRRWSGYRCREGSTVSWPHARARTRPVALASCAREKTAVRPCTKERTGRRWGCRRPWDPRRNDGGSRRAASIASARRTGGVRYWSHDAVLRHHGHLEVSESHCTVGTRLRARYTHTHTHTHTHRERNTYTHIHTQKHTHTGLRCTGLRCTHTRLGSFVQVVVSLHSRPDAENRALWRRVGHSNVAHVHTLARTVQARGTARPSCDCQHDCIHCRLLW
jgi:hypothetical protein